MNLLTPGAGLLAWTALLILLLITGLFFVFKTWKRQDINQTTKLLWTLLLISAPILGVILYLLFGRGRKTSAIH